MASLKDVKVKIAGVGKTKQITKAMYMVASAKLRGAQGRIERFRPYADKFYEILGHLAAQTNEISHPLLEVHKNPERALIVLVTSDRGLCGSLNVTLIARALDEARTREAAGKTVEFICVGKKGRTAIARLGLPIRNPATDEMASFDFALAGRIGKDVTSAYQRLATDEVLLVYPEFRTIASQRPVSLSLLPITRHEEAAAVKEETGHAPASGVEDVIYEPHIGELLARLLPTYVNAQIFRALLDTSASENAARMLAMDNATRNCDDLISTLTLLYNKTRQASITSELIDIVGGAEAL